MLALDHLAVSAGTLDEGVAWVEMALGVKLSGGGKHAHMATHNRLLGLGELYLEVIATDPEAPRPTGPRWFDLDRFQGPPRLTHWICRTDDLDAALKTAPDGAGRPVDLSRGDYRWRFAATEGGRLPFDDSFPALIQWQGDLHPAKALPDAGVRLVRLEITHPQVAALQGSLAGQLADPRIGFHLGPHKSLRATFATPQGLRVLT
ncbi:MAG: VOC family protein [Tabrizicola sp.]|nr:VOC family protein [Tabrizicola sp.]